MFGCINENIINISTAIKIAAYLHVNQPAVAAFFFVTLLFFFLSMLYVTYIKQHYIFNSIETTSNTVATFIISHGISRA